MNNTGIFVVLHDGVLNQQEGVSSISNSNGKFLFYSDGKTIWDYTHQAMPNANSDLNGYYSSTQSSVCLTIQNIMFLQLMNLLEAMA